MGQCVIGTRDPMGPGRDDAPAPVLSLPLFQLLLQYYYHLHVAVCALDYGLGPTRDEDMLGYEVPRSNP